MADFPFVDVIAASCAALRVNGRYIKRHEGGEGELSNNVVLKYILDPASFSTGSAEIPEKYIGQTVTDADLAEASAIVQYLDHQMLELIAGNLQDYWKNLVLLTERKTISSTDYRTLALVASVPSSYKNAMARETAIDKINTLSQNSKWIGKIGDNFPQQNVEIISSVFSATYNKWFYTALTADKNIIKFPHAQAMGTGDTLELSGRVYKHDENNTTRLHYVRVKKI
jgi:hypothetical protein